MYPRKNFAARRTPAGKSAGVRGLLDWIRQVHPKAYAELKWNRPELVAKGERLDGLGDVSSAVGKVTATAQQIASAVLPFLQLDAQRKLLKAQVQRAEQGLPPLEVQNLQLPATRVELDAGAGISSTVKTVAIAGAIGVALWLLLSRRR